MTTDEIRSRFLEFFAARGHQVRPSASLVPADDPTLLFVNAGMVPFKRVFTGHEGAGTPRAVTAQKCVRAGGKHNDLEEVGRTARHHTFFEMLGNFSFGDYFKREAIDFAWSFLTGELGISPDRLWVTVHHTDDDAFRLWREVAGVAPERIFRLGDEDNFWQMGDTGPCGPCSEIHYDMRADGARSVPESPEAFEALGDREDILEIWNLVFMQFDRSAGGDLHPLPRPSIDTGAGLERLAAVLQGVRSNYRTDLFTDLIDRAARIVGVPYTYDSEAGVSYRVLADHTRATAFLLADGVFPSNEGRGYVLRRILRRAVRHAWLLGRREATLAELVPHVVRQMSEAYPELAAKEAHLIAATRAEEERFLGTVDEGMQRFESLAPTGGSGEISGEDAFRLYDTFGFPPDLTELMAGERGYTVDTAGFDWALEAQRARSREDRAASGIGAADDAWSGAWDKLEDAPQEFIAYRTTETETDILAARREGGRVGLMLRENPFYAESGGQVSDHGRVEGDGWRVKVDEVRRIGDRVAVIGPLEGEFRAGRARARVEAPARRDTERNHTATHLLHAALREVLGEHVHQQGSLVAPDRLRFDFAHTAPLTDEEIAAVECRVNEWIWANETVTAEYMGYREALGRGAIALFSEKYGDEVRVVGVPGASMELCGGTHVRGTGEIGMFRVVSESGVAAGVRRLEAVTGPAAYAQVRARDHLLRTAAGLLRTREENVPARLEQLMDEQRTLARDLKRAREQGSRDAVGELLALGEEVAGVRVVAASVDVADSAELRALGDRLRERIGAGVAVLAAEMDGKRSLMAVVGDELISRGVRADRLIREVAAVAGGKGGGRPHMAQAGVAHPERVPEALASVSGVVERQVAEAST